jgi:hypothetical protein
MTYEQLKDKLQWVNFEDIAQASENTVTTTVAEPQKSAPEVQEAAQEVVQEAPTQPTQQTQSKDDSLDALLNGLI